MSFHPSVYGLSLEKESSYIVLINESRPGIVQRHAIGHELAHIFLDHFNSNRPLKDIEREANRAAWKYYTVYKEHQFTQCTSRAAQR